MTALRIPLFRLDSGWLFIVAGLAMCVAGALVSADRELQTLRVQQSLLEAEEHYAYARLRAHEDFLTQLDNPDEALTRRLAAAELNLMPANEDPVLRLITLEVPTVEWIDRTVQRPAPRTVLASHSKLTELATGEYRLWVFGGGVMCVFMGLLLDSGVSIARRRERLNSATSGAAVAESSITIDVRPIEFADADDECIPQPLAAPAVAEVEEIEEDSIESDVEAEDEVDASAEVVCVTDDDMDDETIDDSEGDVEAEDRAEWECEEERDEECDSTEAKFDDEEFADADEEYELIADDVEVVELVEGEDADTEEGSVADLFAAREDQSTRVKDVISIRPSMSVAPPILDEGEDDSRHLAEEPANLFDAPDSVGDEGGEGTHEESSHRESMPSRARRTR